MSAPKEFRKNDISIRKIGFHVFVNVFYSCLLAGLISTMLSAQPQAADVANIVSNLQVEASVVSSTDSEINRGKEVFDQICIYCHQADGIGKPGYAPSLINKELLSIAPDSFFFNTISDGRMESGMPPFSYLGTDKIKAVVAYLRSHSTLPSRVEEIQLQPKSQGRPPLGKRLFDHVCLGCHGPGGSGYLSGGTGTAIGKLGFLNKVSDGFIRTTIKEGRSNTRMRGFQGPGALAHLSDVEIDHIIAYLRTNPSK